jgi:hypothetical protein
VTRVPFRLNHHLVMVEGTVRGGPALTLIVDTGASGSVLTPEAAKRSGIDPTRGEETTVTAADGVPRATVMLPSEPLALGGETFAGVRFTVVDLSSLTAPLGERIDGIVGLDVLARADLEIDRAGAELRLHAGEKVWGDPGCAFELGAEEDLIRFPATIGGQAVTAVLDLGADESMLNWEAAALAGVGRDHPGLERMEGRAAGALGDTFELFRARFEQVGVCGLTLDGETLQVSDMPAFEGVLPAGTPGFLVGNDLMARYRVVIAFRARRIHFLSP